MWSSGRCFRQFTLLVVVLLSAVAGSSYGQDGSSDKTPSLAEELPRIPATEPDQALGTFEVQRGFTLQLAASEPNVSDPVDACFDEFGRMFVAEMHGYPFSQEPTRLNPKGGGKPDAGVIRMLEDTNGDGRFDRSTKFADQIRWPTSVVCSKGGVFVLAPPSLWYFKDTNNDGVADVREVIFEGFNRDNVQAVANNLKWGLDHRIYGAGGRNPSVIQRGGEDLLKLGSSDFSFDPVTFEVASETGGVQFGHSFDDWGRRFVCSNSNHIQQVLYPYAALSRNPGFTVSNPIPSISKEGAAAPVYRRSSAEPWRIVRTRRRVADPRFAGLPATERVPIGFFTSATGVTIYRGAAWPDEFRGQAFIGDVGANLVHRKTMAPNGVAMLATRADQNVEFIASTDNWFRPTNFVNAPDGTLYVLDMYRETIEHPYSIPDDIKEHLDLESGDNRGRIYRILGPKKRRLPVERLGDLSSVELVAKLESPNCWTRETAHRLLFERQDRTVIEPLQRLVRESASPLGRMHALWSLAGLRGLDDDTLLAGLSDPHPGVRSQTIRIGGLAVTDSSRFREELKRLARDNDQELLFQLAITVCCPAEATLEVAPLLLARSDIHPDVRSALMTSIGDVASELVWNELPPENVDGFPSADWYRPLVSMVAAQQFHFQLLELLAGASHPATPSEVRSVVLQAAGDGLARRGKSLQQVLADDQQAELRSIINGHLAQAANTAVDPELSVSERAAAVGLLRLANEATALPALEQLLSPAVPQSLQIAAVRALSQFRSDRVASQLIAHWQSFTPAVRNEASDTLTATVDRATALLNGVKDGAIRSAELSRDRKQLLLNHPNATLRKLAESIIGAEVSTNRTAVVTSYEAALELPPDVSRGREFFLKKCSVCHRVEQEGHAVGPDIVSVQNKSPRDLLVSILDPNREAQPNFNVYNVVTLEGRVLSGLIVNESAATITLRRAESKESVIDRSNIDELTSTGKSLMPEGLEKEMSPQQLADVIAFVKSLGSRK
jgi:putative membrane-bound dehydrogenase-like protein